jgi:hypothetical protein
MTMKAVSRLARLTWEQRRLYLGGNPNGMRDLQQSI